MQAVLSALTAELKRLKSLGVKTVSVPPETVTALRAVLGKRVGQQTPESNLTPPPQLKSAPPVEPSRPVFSTLRVPTGVAADAFTLPPPVVELPPGEKEARWAALRELVLNHPVCLGQVRKGKKLVFGVGRLDSSIMFVGEAPGAEEEVQGEPFVGPAGQLLTKMILGMGLKREEVYIGNIMNWRPQMPVAPGSTEQVGNRPPTSAELAFCLPFLRAQIEVVQPKVLVALGKTAVDGLLGSGKFKTLGEARGLWHEFAGWPVMVTYRPSYILREPTNRKKRLIWEDLLKVMERVGLAISDKQRGYFLEQ